MKLNIKNPKNIKYILLVLEKYRFNSENQMINKIFKYYSKLNIMVYLKILLLDIKLYL